MAESKIARQWDHTATLASLIVNSNPYIDKKVSMFDFHPYMKKQKEKPIMMPVSILKSIFCKEQKT